MGNHIDLCAVPRADVGGVLDAYLARNPHHDQFEIDLIVAAHALADEAHREQKRSSGEPYITHPVAVATAVANIGLDAESVAAALCHDVVEDTPITTEELGRALTPAIASLVEALTKIDKVKIGNADAANAATMRKILVAIAADPRVLVIKLADRHHNMLTLGALPPARQQRIAKETLEVYAPLAHRLGMSEVKWQLEDLAFSYLYPDRHAEIAALVHARAPQRDAYLGGVVEQLTTIVRNAGLSGAVVTARGKHLWSVYEKMLVQRTSFEQIHDLLGVRIVVDEARDCYTALGELHAHLQPLPGAFKDYISTPKFNLYQSLHTQVVGPVLNVAEGKLGPFRLEVQIRTHEMHARAENGVAAHYSYKQAARRRSAAVTEQEPAWLQRLLDWHVESNDPAEFMAQLRADLGQGEVVVLTPKGEVISLPTGACGIDFAYAVHTEIGNRCIGVRVNNKLRPLSAALSDGDIVTVLTSDSADAGPKPEWLTMARTPKARSRIRSYLAKERREDEAELGEALLDRHLLEEQLPASGDLPDGALDQVASTFSLSDGHRLLEAVGQHHVDLAVVTSRIAALLDVKPSPALPADVRATALRRTPRRARSRPGVHAEGLSDIELTLAECCSPVSGDHIVGYLRTGAGVTVHRANCSALAVRQPSAERMVDVEWTGSPEGHRVSLEVQAFDRAGLLMDVANVLTGCGVNITGCRTRTTEDQIARQSFEFTIGDLSHLEQVKRAVKQVAGVFAVLQSRQRR